MYKTSLGHGNTDPRLATRPPGGCESTCCADVRRYTSWGRKIVVTEAEGEPVRDHLPRRIRWVLKLSGPAGGAAHSWPRIGGRSFGLTSSRFTMLLGP